MLTATIATRTTIEASSDPPSNPQSKLSCTIFGPLHGKRAIRRSGRTWRLDSSCHTRWLLGCRLHGSWPETGFEEITAHVLELDLGLVTADSHLRVVRYAQLGSQQFAERAS